MKRCFTKKVITMENTKGSKYEKELVEVFKTTSAKAIGLIIIEGDRGSSFDVRASDESYFRRLPAALIEPASKIEGQLAQKDLERKMAKEAEQKNGN